MPNWIKTIVKAEGLSKLNIFCKDKEGFITLDFDKIIPQPKTEAECPECYLKRKDDHIQASADKPWFNWYAWNNNNWGVKWNARVWDDKIEPADEIAIATPNGCPIPVLKEISRMLGNTALTVETHDEDNFYQPIYRLEWIDGRETGVWKSEWDEEKEDFGDFHKIT